MNTQAFVLNDNFIAEVWEKIQYLKELQVLLQSKATLRSRLDGFVSFTFHSKI